NVLVILGVAIGTAVLTGALLLGDSLKGSLQSLTSDRLGKIECALISEKFFPANLADRLGQDVVPAIVLRGTVLRRTADGSTLLNRAGRVQIVGIDDRFWSLFSETIKPLSSGIILNQALADVLQLDSTDSLEIRMGKPSSIPKESVLGSRNSEEALVLESTQLAGILPNQGMGRFTLQPMLGNPLIAYVRLESLQKRLAEDQQYPPASANVLLATKQQDWQSILQQKITLEDLGFTLVLNPTREVAVLSSRRLLLEPKVVKAVQSHLTEYQKTPTLTYLANRIFRMDGDSASEKFVPYSTVVGVEQIHGQKLEANDVIINEFVRDDLGEDTQKIRIEYFEETEGHRLIEREHDFHVREVVPIKGPSADPTWTPEFPGMKGTLAEWQPPFPPEQWHREWVRKRDEDYYKIYRATPKLFIHPDTARKLFSSRYGDSTSIRVAQRDNQNFDEAGFQQLRNQLLAALPPQELGLTWKNIKEEGMNSAVSGSTTNMFGGLFAGFSLFIIISAALLVALLFRLRLEKRAQELGILLATGWPVKKVRRLAWLEGFILAALGGVLGIPLALGYAWLMIYTLRYGWGGLLASDSLSLHYTPLTLFLGWILSILIAMLAIYLSLRSMVRLPAPVLLSGRTERPGIYSISTKARSRIAWILYGLAAGLVLYGMTLPVAQKPGSFFGAGFLFLFASLLLVRQRLRQAVRELHETSSISQLGRMNLNRSPSRSLSTIALLGAGCFLVVAVGAFRKGKVDFSDRSSGTGGYSLLAETDVPLRNIPVSLDDWKLLLGDRYDEHHETVLPLRNLTWIGFRLRSGDDVSCLNLYQPAKPRVLGATLPFLERGGFEVKLARSSENKNIQNNPWLKLVEEPALNIFLDDHTAQWVMQKQPGDEISLANELDASKGGTFAGMISGSIFQSELIIGENQFRELYPSEAGYRYFLIDVSAREMANVRNSLEILLGESHGMTVESTAEKLAGFHAVENTYIGTFQALGGLGLLLGTAGLALVILRNVQERKGEMALLQAVGFTKNQLARLIWGEVLWITFIGIAVGCFSALLVVLPMWNSGVAMQLSFWLILVVVLVPLVAVLASLSGLRLALSQPLIPSLRGD
ncbi:MAG TPA: FtsX-like permease family protein, partial [Gemmatales bacterium]|nr:FtsX-like permease family protein [Gemmatales bacterium]